MWGTVYEGRPRFFDEDGYSTKSFRQNQWSLLEEPSEVSVQKWRQRVGDEIVEDEKAVFLDLMRRMLFWPEERPTAEEVL